MSSPKMTKPQLQILKIYIQLTKKKGLHPTIAELEKAGVTRNKCRHHFKTLDDMRRAAKEHEPKVFEKILDEELFSPKNFQRLLNEASKYSRYVITSAVTGCSVHKGFLASIKNYCKKNKAGLLVLPVSDPAAIVNKEFFLDPVLKDEMIIIDDMALNKKLFISTIKLSAKHIDPITGLNRIGQRNGSCIYASPKQRLKMTPTSNKKLPHAMMTTGAITRSAYETNRYMSNRTAYLATHDHVVGALIVEIESDKRYHFRQVQANKSGHFIDLGIMYGPDSTTRMPPELLVLGDFHSGETDATAAGCFITGKTSVSNITGVNRIVLHDGFNGLSINHHEIRNKILRARRAAECRLSLEQELKSYAHDLSVLTGKFDEVIISKSNHDEFLERYLADGTFMEEPHNSALGAELFQAAVKGINPLKYAVEKFGLTNADKITWLDRDEDFKVAGIECGAHGDKGANGARGSLHAMENAYSNSVSGHSHTPEILRGAWQVGTLSRLKLDYNVGPSSWMHTSCLVYPNGSRQLVNVIDGSWCVPEGQYRLDKER